ncbi:MAG: hypothetical protein ACK55Z_27440, partial [bacterium]
SSYFSRISSKPASITVGCSRSTVLKMDLSAVAKPMTKMARRIKKVMTPFVMPCMMRTRGPK